MRITAQNLGLKNSLKERIIRPFWNYRGNENKPGIPIQFSEFLKTRPDHGEIIRKDGRPITLEDIFIDMGTDPYQLCLNNLASRDDDFRYLFGPILEDIIWKGFNGEPDAPAMWQSLCAATGVPVAQESIQRTWIRFNGEPAPTAEGELFPEVTLQYGDETIAWKKKGLTLRLTVEYLRANPLPIIADYLIYVGRVLQYLENKACVLALVNGDLAAAANAAPVVGVESTQIGIDYVDFLKCWSRGGILGELWFTVLSGETMGVKLGLIDEFKVKETGASLVTIANRPEPQNMNRWLSEDVPEHQALLVDTSHAVRQRVFVPLNVMQSSRPENWTSGVTVGYSSTFERLADKALVAIDETLLFSEYGFPTWFTIGGNRS